MPTTSTDAPTSDAGKPAETGEQQQAEQPKPTETVEFWKQKAREQEKRAKDNAAAAKRLKELEDSQKTAEQKAADQLTQAVARAEAAEKRASALQVATEFRLSSEDAELLAGMPDEDAMRSLGERLATAAEDQRQADETEKRRRPKVPNQGKDTTEAKADPRREFARQLFGRDT